MAEIEPFPQNDDDPSQPPNRREEITDDDLQDYLLRAEQLSNRLVQLKMHEVWHTLQAGKEADKADVSATIVQYYDILAKEISLITKPHPTISGLIEQWRQLICPRSMHLNSAFENMLDDPEIDVRIRYTRMQDALYWLLRSALGDEHVTLKKIHTHLALYLQQALKEQAAGN